MDAADRGGVLRPNQAGTRPAYAPAIRAAADLGEASPDLAPWDVAVLAAIAYRQPIVRNDLSRAFGREVSRELIGRQRARPHRPGPRSPRPGAPYTFVTTEGFLAAFDLQSLRDLPDAEMMGEAELERTDEKSASLQNRMSMRSVMPVELPDCRMYPLRNLANYLVRPRRSACTPKASSSTTRISGGKIGDIGRGTLVVKVSKTIFA
jgi:chromosome segregation and condensation protein ScpB